MIVTRVLGGLGNQMFHYAAGLALAERRRTVLKLDLTWFHENTGYDSHNRYGLSCFNITEQFATQEEIDRVRGVKLTRAERWSVTVASLLRLRGYVRQHARNGNSHVAERLSFYPGFFEQPDNTYLQGMWQSEAFFSPVSDLLRLHFSFRYPSPAVVFDLAEKIQAKPSVAVHVRRGDYHQPRFRGELGLLGNGYYRGAIEHVRTLCPDAVFYVFSDDIDAVSKDLEIAHPHVFIRLPSSAQPHDSLRLMSLCHHAIIANSTFSWWGAWLNSRPDRIVIAPDPWQVGRPKETSEVVPPTWTRHPADYLK